MLVAALNQSDFLELPYPDGPPPLTPSPTIERATPTAQATTTISGTSFADTFDDPKLSRFVSGEDESVRYAFVDGRYRIEAKKPELLVWNRAEGVYGTMRFEMELIFPPATPLSAGGVIFHMQDGENFYLFSLSSDGFYSLELYENNRATTLIDWTETEYLGAKGRSNRLRIETDDEEIGIYLNGKRLELTSDNTFTTGEIALAVASFSEGGAAVHFDNVRVTTDVAAPQ
jgi:hypothetical protein